MARSIRWALVVAAFAGAVASTLLVRLDGHAAQSLEAEGVQVASLKDQLVKGLRARRQIEFQFLGRVVQLVNNKQLPQSLVQGTFSWTVKKYRDRKYLVPYFEQVLRRRAEAEKITVLKNVPTTLTVTE